MVTANPIREKILNAAEKRMIAFGYRKVLMDEIARDLAMSKNTIYKEFRGKEEIAATLFARLKERINDSQHKVESACSDPLEIIQQNIMFLQKELTPWFENFLNDIKQDLPPLWEDFTHYRTEKILEIECLIKDGIQKGKFRRVEPAIAVRAFLGAVDEIINPDFLQNQNISFNKALAGVLDIWARGIEKK